MEVRALSRARQFARCFLHCFIRALDICCITAVSVVVNAGEEAAEESEGGGWRSHCRMFINLTRVVFLLEISSVSVILTVQSGSVDCGRAGLIRVRCLTCRLKKNKTKKSSRLFFLSSVHVKVEQIVCAGYSSTTYQGVRLTPLQWAG